MRDRVILGILIVAGFILAAVTVRNRFEAWRNGRELAVLRREHLNLEKKQRVLDVLLTRVRDASSLRSHAERIEVVLAEPARESFQVALARLRGFGQDDRTQMASKATRPEKRLKPSRRSRSGRRAL